MPTTEPSWSPSTNVRSSGSPARNGTSVDPGFEKIVVSPRRRRTSNVASRTGTRQPYCKTFGLLPQTPPDSVPWRDGDAPRPPAPRIPPLRDRCERGDRRPDPALARGTASRARAADRHRAGDGRRVRGQPADAARGAAAPVGVAPDPRRARPLG